MKNARFLLSVWTKRNVRFPVVIVTVHFAPVSHRGLIILWYGLSNLSNFEVLDYFKVPRIV